MKILDDIPNTVYSVNVCDDDELSKEIIYKLRQIRHIEKRIEFLSLKLIYKRRYIYSVAPDFENLDLLS